MHDEDGYLRSFTELSREHGFEPLRIDGSVPRSLSGTLYRNGPGLFSIAGHRYEHWFDGDGLVTALRLDEGRAAGASKLVESRGLREERRRGGAYYGSYGTKPPGRWNPWRTLRFLREGGKNPANTSMLVWNERLFALCEIGPPTEIDPDTLATIGETTFDGAVVRPFSAHPHRHASTGALYNVGVRIGRPNAIDLVLMRPDGTAGRLATIPLSSPTLIHDFILTEKHAVIFAAPLSIALGRVLFGRTSFAGAMSWDPGGSTEVIVVPLDAPGNPVRFETDPFWIWHVGNAFERGGEIVADVVRYATFAASAKWLEGVMHGTPGEADGYLTRMTIDPGKRTLRTERLRERTGEFPRIDPSQDARLHTTLVLLEHSDAEAGRRGPPNELVRLDTETGRASRYRFAHHEWPSEAVHAPGDHLITLVYDARTHRSAWWIFDTRAIADGPIARVQLDHHVPLGFHGAWRAG